MRKSQDQKGKCQWWENHRTRRASVGDEKITGPEGQVSLDLSISRLTQRRMLCKFNICTNIATVCETKLLAAKFLYQSFTSNQPMFYTLRHSVTVFMVKQSSVIKTADVSFFFFPSLLWAEVQPTSGPQCWHRVLVQCARPGRGGELVGVCDVCVWCAGKAGLSRMWTACQVFIVRPSRRDLLSGSALTGAVFYTSQWLAKSICFSHASAANTLTLLIKVSAMVTVCRGHRRTLFIMCIGIIWNNSLVCGCTPAEVWTPTDECLMLYCTWRPSALTTRPHGQVNC